ncbi:putative cytokinetic ring protein SteA, partial [Microbacteriaceae bacterium K1510]|nr:putative cytokinetic ring protein SteA [Microbacteriaceae bacterium K1510]
YKQDLRALASYIKEYRPVLVAVDGGADALLESGYTPDLIVGDMDSVSDQALKSGAEIVVHAFPDGYAPGQHRVESLGLPFHLLPAPGTSEDVAMLLAYEERAELIVTIGTHTN